MSRAGPRGSGSVGGASRGHQMCQRRGYGLTLLILWGLYLGGGTEEHAWSFGGDSAVLSDCPWLHRIVAQGATAMIPLQLPQGKVVLCKVNTQHSRCDWVVVLLWGRLYYIRRAFRGHIVLHTGGLVVRKMKADQEGEYRVLSGQNGTCLAQILLTAVGPLFFYRFFLLLPGLLITAVLVLMWDWLTKVRAHPSTDEEQRHGPVISDS